MQAANEHCFSQLHWRVIAQGFSAEDWFEHGLGKGTGGIQMPRPVDMPVQHRYYRFASSTAKKDSLAGGGWWIEYETFKTIENFAQEHGHSLPYAARLFLALPYDWTRVDRLVSDLLAIPLKAYRGLGKRAEGADSTPHNVFTPLQNKALFQLYVPGLWVRSDNPKLYQRAFPDPRIEYISGNRRAI